MAKSEETLYQKLVRRVRIAQQASHAVDYFDLNSPDPKSRAKFKLLEKASDKAFKKLHKLCRSHKFKNIQSPRLQNKDS